MWLLLLCTAPVPYTFGAVESAPPIRLAFLSTLIVAARVTEGDGGWIWSTFVALALAQCALYGAFLWMVASFVSRLFARASPGRRRLAVAAVAASAIAIACWLPIYRTPISSAAMYSTLFEIFR